MPSPLSTVPAQKRRVAAGTLGLFAALFTAVGAVTATGASTATLKAFVAVSLAVALLLALLAWGFAYSVRLDAAEHDFDEAVGAVLASRPATLCDCGHEHDPAELHVTDAPACEHDGSGAACAHDCDTCVLAALRPAPNATRAQRLRG